MQAKSNAKLAEDNPGVLAALLEKEVKLNRFKGQFKVPPFKNMHITPLSIREKSTPGEFHLLHHLSYLYDDRSVNLGIPVNLKSVQYETVGDAIAQILELGRGCFLGKMDIKSAFRIILVRPDQYWLLGVQFNGRYYYDTVLAMGCGSSCRIFEDFSRALVWVLKNRLGVVRIVHLIDDFLIIELTYEDCKYSMDVFRAFANKIGLPLAEEKTLGPSNVIVFLGFELSSAEMLTRISRDKIDKYVSGCCSRINARCCSFRP